MLNYSEDNSDLSSGCNLDHNDPYDLLQPMCKMGSDDCSGLDFRFLDPSQVIPCVSEGSDTLSTSTTTLCSRPYSTRHPPDGTSWVDYTEVNMDLSSGSACHDPRGEVVWLPATNALRDPRLDSLRDVLDALAQPWPAGSFATDYQAIPNLHPIVAMICADQDWAPISGSGVRYHLYTDGSAKLTPSPVAAWAFQVLLESLGPWGVQFHRIGYTGAVLGDDVPEAQVDALDAEALALIFAADWLLSLPQSVDCVLHFDALAAGCGASGTQNEPAPAMCPRPLQHYARCLLSMAQAKHISLRWAHVKAHTGQPDNEVADSALVSGWDPPCRPSFRLRSLLEHPLRDWAWMEYNPTAELPDLATTPTAAPSPPSLDTTIWTPGSSTYVSDVTEITWSFGSANVRTMDYDSAHHSDKLPLLRAQLQEYAFDVFAFQECRGKLDQCVEDDEFIRICAAGQHGQGGVELWLRKEGAFLRTGFGGLTKDHLAVWHSSSTVRGVICRHPALECTFVVIYGPQSGRPEDEIRTWWTTLMALLRDRPVGGRW